MLLETALCRLHCVDCEERPNGFMNLQRSQQWPAEPVRRTSAGAMDVPKYNKRQAAAETIQARPAKVLHFALFP